MQAVVPPQCCHCKGLESPWWLNDAQFSMCRLGAKRSAAGCCGLSEEPSVLPAAAAGRHRGCRLKRISIEH